MMSTHVHMMAAGSSSGTMLAVNLTLIPAGKRVCTVIYSSYQHLEGHLKLLQGEGTYYFEYMTLLLRNCVFVHGALIIWSFEVTLCCYRTSILVVFTSRYNPMWIVTAFQV